MTTGWIVIMGVVSQEVLNSNIESLYASIRLEFSSAPLQVGLDRTPDARRVSFERKVPDYATDDVFGAAGTLLLVWHEHE